MLIGAVLGFGAPLGFLVLSGVAQGLEPSSAWLCHELAAPRRAYAYMAVATPVAFAIFGRMLGRRQEALRRTFAELDRLREEFAAVVAHDLRNPIQSILLRTEYLLDKTTDGDVAVPSEVVRSIHGSARRLADMVRDLLDASRLEAERLSLDPRPVAVPEAVAALVERIRPTLGAHPIEVRVASPVPVISADATRLDQMLTNLIENAAKYSPERAPILVHVRAGDGGALVAIEDRGTGIAPEDVPRLFDRFYQTRRAREKKSGLGLGLYITKGLITAHGGRIDVRSEPGRGSTFSLWFPASTH